MYKIEENELRELYEDKKLSTRQIAEKFGCSFPIILNRLEKYSIPRRKSYWKWGWIAKNDNPNKGKKFLARGMKGELNPFFDKHHSKEMLEFIHLRVKEYYRTHSAWNKGLTKEINGSVHQYALSISKTRKGKFKGKDNSNWKGEKSQTRLILRIKELPEYKEWRLKVYQRDNYTCQDCGDDKGKNLEAHHKKAFSKMLRENNITSVIEAQLCKELWDIDNGITLCKKCHRLTNNYGAKALFV